MFLFAKTPVIAMFEDRRAWRIFVTMCVFGWMSMVGFFECMAFYPDNVSMHLVQYVGDGWFYLIPVCIAGFVYNQYFGKEYLFVTWVTLYGFLVSTSLALLVDLAPHASTLH